MGLVLIIGAGLIEAGVLAFLILRASRGSGTAVDVRGQAIAAELDRRRGLLLEFRALFEGMVPLPTTRARAREIASNQETLRAERGRITITQAELETVENRLRELEEIERELEASGLETKEELNILKRKEAELASRNDALRSQIASSVAQMDTLLNELQLSAEMQEQIQAAKTEILSTEENITTLLLQIEGGNEQYFILKRRYDALDIEYAQLYEKFSEADAAAGASKKEADS